MRSALLASMLILSGCGSGPSPAATPPTSQPTTQKGISTFDNKKSGIRFDYPSDWKPKKAETAIFCITAPAGYSDLSLDVPSLPPHFPGMISVDMIVNGYIDDTRKHQMPDAKVEERADVTVAGEHGKRVKQHGHENKVETIDVAVIVMHRDRVYILSCDSDVNGYNTARGTLDAAVASVKWAQ